MDQSNNKSIKSPLDIVGDFNYNALMQAAYYSNFPIIKKLIESGADINATDNDGRNSLHLVAMSKNEFSSEEVFECCKFLVENGIDINLQDNFGDTPLIRFIYESKNHKYNNSIMYLIDCINKK